MPLYMTQFAYTPDAWAALVKNPENRANVLRTLFQQAGGRLVSLYYAFGEYDGVLIFEAPDETTATAVLLAAIAPGQLKATKTTLLLTAEHAMEAMRNAGTLTYRAPGRGLPEEL